MDKREKKLQMITIAFSVIVVASIGLLAINVMDYTGLLNSVAKVEVSLKEITTEQDDRRVNIIITVRVENPTSYDRLKFSSMNCQVYRETDNGEVYIGATAYALPTDVPLRPNEEYLYSATLGTLSTQYMGEDGVLLEGLDWRIRCVVHFSNPIRKYYQTYNFYGKNTIA
jgi:hypothetical protein